MKPDKIYLVVPRIIEQPTWGGHHILEQKKWDKRKELKGLKTGQSYELFSGSSLRGDISSTDDQSFTGELGHAMEPDKFKYLGDKKKLISLKKIIKRYPKEFLGPTAVKKNGGEMKILIKFTQAKGNSFQMHLAEGKRAGKWVAKPESWYYFDPGLITLGVKKNIDWEKYKRACVAMERELRTLGEDVKKGKMKLSAAKKKAAEIVKKYDPYKFVNKIRVKKDTLIDLSFGAVHHSWEESGTRNALGNIVYELCLDVMDPVSSIRCFDKGKIKDDGNLRKLHIDDYFLHIDRSDEMNDPKKHILSPTRLYVEKKAKILGLLRTKYYCLDKMILSGTYSGAHTDSRKSFHHLFAKKGNVIIKTEGEEIQLTEGHSCIVPAAVGKYAILPRSRGNVEILKTFVN